MQHLLIGGYVVSVVLGFISFHHLDSQYKIHKNLFLKTYGRHILMLNLIVISLTVTRYFKVNILRDPGAAGSTWMSHISDGLLLLRKGIEYCGIIAISYLLVKTLYGIQNRPLTKPIKNIFIIVMILSAFALGIGLTVFLIKQDATWINLFCTIIWGGVIFIVIAVFSLNAFEMQSLQHEKYHVLRLFQSFYIVLLSLFFVQNLFRYPFQNFILMIIIWPMNIFPLYWSRHRLRMDNSNGFALNVNRENIERLISEYSITDREQEILECILHGLSNREIQNRLFLSPHTVKNHNYNLYRKLGVRNRIELMRKVFEYQNSN